MILNKQLLTSKILPTDQPLLGMDYGSKIIGLAISDCLLWGASPFASWKRKKLVKDDFLYLSGLVKQHKIGGLIVGWPLRSDGTESQICKAVENFCLRLEKEISVPIILWDERFSSLGAASTLRGQGYSGKKLQNKIDKYAACHILQGFLDYWRNQTQL